MTEHEDHRCDLPLYVTGDLDPDRRAAVEHHLRGCRACTQALAELEGTVTGLRMVAYPPDDIDLEGFYTDRLAPRLPRRALARRLLIAAALLLAFGMGLAVERHVLAAPPPKLPVPDRVDHDPPEPPHDQAADARLRRAHRAASRAEHGLARGLLGLAALNERE